MKRQNILLVLAFFLAISAGFSQSSQDGDAIFKKVSKQYTLNPDGSILFNVVKQVKLLTYNSFHRLYGETFIVYNPDFQKLKINSCYTIMRDGKKVITPANAFNEVLPRFAANAPVYNKLREMVVTHTGLEIGATIYLDYEIVTAKGYFPFFMGKEALYENCPVEDYSVSLKTPLNCNLRYSFLGRDQNPVVITEGNSKIVSWKFKDVPAYIPEGFQPQEDKFLPILVFHDAKDIKASVGFLTSQPAFGFQYNEAMKAAAQKIRNDNKKDLLAVLKLQEMVINDFNLYPVPLVYNGFRCRTSVETWANGGGTELEKAVLLTSLLNSIDIKALPVAVVSGFYIENSGILNALESFVVKVTIPKEKDIYLSLQAADDQNRVMKLGERNLVLLDPYKGASTFTESWQENEIELSGKLDFDSALAVKGSMHLELSGACNPYFDLLKNDKKASSLLKGPFGEPKETVITKLEGPESQFDLKIAKENVAKRQGKYSFLDLPYCDKGLSSWHLPDLTEFRLNPFEISWPIAEKYSFEYTLPDGTTLVTPEINEKIQNSAGEFNYSVKQSGKIVKITKSVSLYRSKQDKDYYQNLRFILNKWQAEAYRKVVFKK